MKLALRVAALFIVVAGVAAASVSSKTPAIPSHQSATATLPAPCCGPGMICPK
ncbi:MAG: hypothetical protein KGM96_14095 [Acidobacteriota bacterium]|nr:hypothetical protein [Acidobacteriota bacterium]